MPYSIMLDAGHGGRDPGAVYNGRQEKDDTLQLVLAIGEILQNNGVDVEYTRTTDVYESPYQKAMEANEAGVDFFVSIHRNSFPQDNVVSGVESLVYNKEGIKYEMAQDINEQLETVGFVNLGVKERPNLVVLRRTRMPAVLVEVGFINSETDNRLFDDNFDDIARAIADGILDTLDIGSDDVEQDDTRYTVQTGAYRNRRYADELRMELQEMGFPARIEEGDGYFRVRVGSYESLSDAISMEQRLKRAGYPTIIVT
ncbi:MAG: N-acetylmuramoyl-L-alanine amidase [Faecalimonas sp.]|nr:N-acetylmuramoyl-L-alanine amidase [Faecalimonas sp.]